MKAANPKKATGSDYVSPRDLSIIGDPVIHSLLRIFMHLSPQAGNYHVPVPYLRKDHQQT